MMALLSDLPLSNTFTSKLPPDPLFPTPSESNHAPRERLGPRIVNGALFTFIRPAKQKETELLAVSPAALRDLGLRPGVASTAEFREVVAGNRILGWDEVIEKGIYPWAQCYGANNVRYEVQLKGAGKTPYSRFADGQAVLRSSIREFIASEALHALGIPTTRALAITLLPHNRVRRERIEPAAIVARFAESWLRIGSFDLPRQRADRKFIRRVATYLAEDVLGGWETLPGKPPASSVGDKFIPSEPQRGFSPSAIEGSGLEEENRFVRLYREIVQRNAKTVGAWQAYGFMNGVLNTDNTSLLGLSMDFGPFGFMDNFDRHYTPNHDDFTQRYSYRNQPAVIWWNLVRLGEALAELLGAGGAVDDSKFTDHLDGDMNSSLKDDIMHRAESVIERIGLEYRSVYLAEYERLMRKRLGLHELEDHRGSDQQLVSDLLDMMESLEIDFNHFFRRLGELSVSAPDDTDARHAEAARFMHHEGITATGVSQKVAETRIGRWLDRWRHRLLEDYAQQGSAGAGYEEIDERRRQDMNSVNPKFIPRTWVLDEVIDNVERKHDRDIIPRVLHMALHPFDEMWDCDDVEAPPPNASSSTYSFVTQLDGDVLMTPAYPDGVETSLNETMQEVAERFCGDVPRSRRSMQCSCSS